MTTRQWWWVAGSVGVLLIVVPGIDLTISGWFHDPIADDPNQNFYLRQSLVLAAFHQAILIFAHVAGIALILGSAYAAVVGRFWGLERKAWLFLLLAFALGPGLTANVVFKNGWHRARPSQVEQFGGNLRFTPPLVISDQCGHNCSFVAGDPSVMFAVTALAYVVRRRRRAFFYGGLGLGLLAGALRIVMGAHFFSDVLFGGAFMLAIAAGVHALLYGRAATAAAWREWLPLRRAPPGPTPPASPAPH